MCKKASVTNVQKDTQKNTVIVTGLPNYDPVPIISICDCLLISNE